MTCPLINVRFILLISASFIVIFSSIAIYFCLPILISHLIRTQLTLSSNSGSFENWRLNSVIDRMYLYNITNLSDLNNELALSISEDVTGAKRPKQVPKLQQLGPFTFRQDREKLNIKFDPRNETVVYDQKKSWTFLPELSSIKSVEDLKSALVNHINVPLAGTTLNPEYGEFIDPIVMENDLRLFLNHSVDTLLFEGYLDVLMEQAKASGQIDVDKFGWMHNQNNSMVKSLRVFTGSSNATLDKFGLIDEFEHRHHLNIWHNNNSEPTDFRNVKCNDFRLSSTGEFFPPPEFSIIAHNSYHTYTEHQQQLHKQARESHQYGDNTSTSNTSRQNSNTSQPDPSSTKSMVSDESLPDVTKSESNTSMNLNRDDLKLGKSISIFMPELCRTIRLFYNGSYNFRGVLLVDRYVANEQTFMYQSDSEQSKLSVMQNNSLIESNRCYCNYNETSKQTSCPPNGMMDLFACRKGSPISISFPHFLYSTKDKSWEPYSRLFSEDTEPNEREHQFFIDLESTLNIPINVQIVLQFNVHLRNDQVMNFTREYAYLFEDPSGDRSKQPLKDFYLPQMWVKSSAEVDDRNLAHLVFIQNHLKLVTPLTTIVIFGFASILLMASAKLAFALTYGSQSARKSSSCDHESCSSFNGSQPCSYLEEKKKYFNMQLLAEEHREKPTNKFAYKFASSMGNIAASDYGMNNFKNRLSFEELNRPTTSKKANNLAITSPSSSDGQNCCESQPLNE